MLIPIINKIEDFNLVDFLKIVGALQLHASNIHHATRIEALAHALCCFQYDAQKPNISNRRLLKILNEEPLGGNSDFRLYEDPCNNLFTEALTFFNGSYLVFPGILEAPTYILKNLNDAVFFSSKFKGKNDFINEIVSVNIAILSISNEIARRVGLKRYEHLPAWTQDIEIPKDMVGKKNAVVFNKEQVENIIPLKSLPALERFITQAGSLSNESFSFEKSPLHVKPIIRVGDLIIVAEPLMLIAALKHQILVIANKHGLLSELIAEYQTSTCSSVFQSMELLDFQRIKIDLPSLPDELKISQSLWTLDLDKVACSIVVSDDLLDFSETDMFGVEGDNSKKADLLGMQLGLLESFVYKNLKHVNELFFVIVYSSLGRASALQLVTSYIQADPVILTIGAFELEIVSFVEAGDSMKLYKFAKARKDWKNNVRVVSWSTLAEFEIYRNHKYSFYLGDEKRPDLITIGTEFGGEVYAKALREMDMHAVPYLINGSYVEVINTEKLPAVPIYTPVRNLRARDRIEFFVETLLPAWVCANEGTLGSEKLTEYHPNLGMLVDMVAYWLWQFQDDLGNSYTSAVSFPFLHIEIALDLDQDWKIPNTADGLLTCEIVEERIFAKVGSSFINVINAQDNAGELRFMGIILEAISNYFESKKYPRAARYLRSRIASILTVHSLDPRKKKVLAVHPGNHPELQPVRGTDYRKVKDSDVGVLLDDLGAFLADKLHIPPGPIPAGEVNDVLQKTVNFYYQELVKLVNSLSPIHLLDFLVSNYEAIVYYKATRALTISTQLSCYSGIEGFHKLLSEQMSNMNQAARACRFIIEYVVAKPPAGIRSISYDVYDRLMAIAAEIMARGSQSDMVKYEFFEVRLQVLESGRLGVNYDDINQAQMGYLESATRERIKHARHSFSEWWKERGRNPENALPEHIIEANNAFTAEFGLSLSDLAELIAQIADHGESPNQLNQLNKRERSGFSKELSEKLNWSLEKTILCLDFLLLKPRSDFLAPELPFRSADVYPWRFSRSLSYMRKPLMEVHEQGLVFICWGARQLFESFEYIMAATLNGRLQPYYYSDQMKAWQGKLSFQDGEDFVTDVVQIVSKIPALIFKTKVRKIGSKRIALIGNELGDIDMLLIAPKRKRIILIECKNLSIARTPYEMKRELENLFLGTQNRLSTVVKHRRRQEWIKENLNLVFEQFDLSPRGRWKVDALLLVNNDLITTYFHKSPMPVLSLLKFEEDFLPTIL